MLKQVKTRLQCSLLYEVRLSTQGKEHQRRKLTPLFVPSAIDDDRNENSLCLHIIGGDLEVDLTIQSEALIKSNTHHNHQEIPPMSCVSIPPRPPVTRSDRTRDPKQ